MSVHCKIGKVTYKDSKLVAFPSRQESYFNYILKDLENELKNPAVDSVAWVITTGDERPTTFHGAKAGVSVATVTGAASHLHNLLVKCYL